MKNKILLCALFVSGLMLAQEVEPKYEIDGNLVKATYYYDNGSVKQEGFYKDGKVHGQWVSYTEKGIKTSMGEYNKGEKTGKWFFWSDGSLNEVDYKDSRVAVVNKWEKETVAYRNK